LPLKSQIPLTREEFKSCFDELFDPVRNYLYYRCGDDGLSTDVTQETFIKLWKKQFPYEANRTKGLVYKMANDALISHLRRKKVKDDHLNSLELKLELISPEKELEFKELQAHYEHTLAQLPEKQRTVFLMNRIDELSYREIAERLSISVKAVEKRMSSAIAFLKQKLEAR